jgi:hypothetical protein
MMNMLSFRYVPTVCVTIGTKNIRSKVVFAADRGGIIWNKTAYLGQWSSDLTE